MSPGWEVSEEPKRSENTPDLEAQRQAGAIVFKGQVLNTGPEIKAAAKGASKSELSDLAKELGRAGIQEPERFLERLAVSGTEAPPDFGSLAGTPGTPVGGG